MGYRREGDWIQGGAVLIGEVANQDIATSYILSNLICSENESEVETVDDHTSGNVEVDGASDDVFKNRMRVLIEEISPGRGKFGRLSGMSGIGQDGWKGAWHGRQRFTQEMIQYICSQRPSDARWLMVGGARQAEGTDAVDAAAAAFVSEQLGKCADEVLALRKYGLVNPTGALRSVADMFESAGRGDVINRAMDCVISGALLAAAREGRKC